MKILIWIGIILVLIRRGGDGRAEVVLLDHGLYEELSPNVRQSLCLLWKAIVLGDHPRMKKHAAELGVTGVLLTFFVLVFLILTLKHVFVGLPYVGVIIGHISKEISCRIVARCSTA